MIETLAIIWLWITAVVLFVGGGGLFLLVLADDVPYSPSEKRRHLFLTGGIGLIGLALIVLLVMA